MGGGGFKAAHRVSPSPGSLDCPLPIIPIAECSLHGKVSVSLVDPTLHEPITRHPARHLPLCHADRGGLGERTLIDCPRFGQPISDRRGDSRVVSSIQQPCRKFTSGARPNADEPERIPPGGTRRDRGQKCLRHVRVQYRTARNAEPVRFRCLDLTCFRAVEHHNDERGIAP